MTWACTWNWSTITLADIVIQQNMISWVTSNWTSWVTLFYKYDILSYIKLDQYLRSLCADKIDEDMGSAAAHVRSRCVDGFGSGNSSWMRAFDWCRCVCVSMFKCKFIHGLRINANDTEPCRTRAKTHGQSDQLSTGNIWEAPGGCIAFPRRNWGRVSVIAHAFAAEYTSAKRSPCCVETSDWLREPIQLSCWLSCVALDQLFNSVNAIALVVFIVKTLVPETSTLHSIFLQGQTGKAAARMAKILQSRNLLFRVRWIYEHSLVTSGPKACRTHNVHRMHAGTSTWLGLQLLLTS